jgi:xylan 1,4-beta-xylosidase
VDFVSSHVYANDTGLNVFGDPTPIPRDRMVCLAVGKLHEDIRRSPFPTLPLFITEYNASYRNEPDVTDAVFMGPWLADTIRRCTGLVDMMSYWTFSDVFEEQGVVKTPFYGGFGLIAERGVPKPAFNAFALLHKLGNHLIPVESDRSLVTQRDDGTLVIALWNYAAPDAEELPDRHFAVELDGKYAGSHVTIWRLDHEHGNALRSYAAMDRPTSPTRAQIAELTADGALSTPEEDSLRGNQLELSIPSQGLVVLEILP